MDKNSGKARGVSYIDTTNKQEYEAYGKSVVLGASMVESLRILLNSRDREFPQGLGNSSGTLGKYLMEHVAFNQHDGIFSVTGRADPPRMTMAREQTASIFRAITMARRATNF